MYYIISEVQYVNSCKEGEIIEAKNLTDAKRKATKMQAWQGSIMKISTNGECVACKEHGGWTDVEYR